MANPGQRVVGLPVGLVDRLDEAAAALGMTTASFAGRVLDGAMRSGAATGYALDERSLIPSRSRPVEPGTRRDWQPDRPTSAVFETGGKPADRVARWSCDGYVLERFGPVGGNQKVLRTNQGWKLTTPEGDKITLESVRRKDAQREAEALMRRREQPDDVDVPGRVRPFHRHTRAVLPPGQVDGHAHPGGSEPHTHIMTTQGGEQWSGCG